MHTSVSEKHIAGAVLLALLAGILLFNCRFTNAPVKVSEKGLLSMLMALALIVGSVRLLRKGIRRA